MTDIGHGHLGFLDDLRIYDQRSDDTSDVVARDTLTEESSCRADAFVEIEGRALISADPGGWSALPSAGFDRSWSQFFDGEALDVASVRTLLYPSLARVETQAEVEATELTFQYDMDEGILRVHLPNDEDPSDVSVLVTTCFNFGTGGHSSEHMVQPYLGETQLEDGDFDESGLPDWNPVDTGTGFSADRDASPLVGGGFSALLEGDGSGSGSITLTQQPTSANGKTRRLFGYYWTPASQPSTAALYVRVGTTTQLERNGYGTEALGDGILLTPTHGRARAFLFDFINHEADVEIAIRLENSAATACSARLDGFRMRPIYGWRRFHPRVAADGIPESEQGSLDVYAGSASTGSGSVKLLNDSTAPFERMFSGDPWSCLGSEVRIRYGGGFPDNGQTIPWDDMLLGQSGIIAGDQFEHVTDEAVTFAFEEGRSILEAEIPSQTYGDAWPDVEERDFSRVRARFFGPQLHVRPARVDTDPTTGYGIHELNDPTYAVGAAFQGTIEVLSFVDEEAAEANDTSRAINLVAGIDWTEDTANGTFQFVEDPSVFVITSGEGPEAQGANDRLDFVANGVTYEISILPALYQAKQLIGTIELAMEAAVGGATVDTDYSNTTHKFNIDWTGAGNFQLLADTGANRHRSVLTTLGFTNSTDYTGATTYTSDVAVFNGADQNYIRCSTEGGYQDDSSGTYTGTPNATLLLGPDIFRYIMGVFLAEPVSKIDAQSFEQARTDCPQVLGVYFGLIASISDTPAGPVTLQSSVDKLEISGATVANGLADISQDGAGVFYWRTRNNITTTLNLFDRDFLVFEGYLNGNDPYGTVRVNYAQDPSTGYVLGVEVTNTDTILRTRRYQQRTFDSYLTVEADAEDARDALAIQARASMRHFRIRTTGKMLRSKPGDIVLLTRSRALGAGGTEVLDAQAFRVLWLKKNYLTREVEAVVHTLVTV